MPKTGMTQETGTVIRWLFKEGDPVEKGEPLLEVMTDKVNLEVEAPASGVLRNIKAFPDDVVPVTQVIAYIAEPDEEIIEEDVAPSAAEGRTLEEAGPEHRPAPPLPAIPARARHPLRVAATPVARRLANEERLDLEHITGTGPVEVITKADVLRAARYDTVPAAALPASAGTISLVGRRKIIAERMQQSAQEAPHIALTVQVDMSQADVSRRGASYSALLVYVVARALRKHPLLNSTLRDDQIVLLDDVNIGVAVATDEGLIVPVVKQADKKTLDAIDGEIKDLVRRAREGKLTLDDVTGGTFTLSNLGMFGITEFRAIINPPEAAILAVGSTVKRAVVVGDEVVVRPIMNITVSADHRILDGVAVANFLSDVKTALERVPQLEVHEPGHIVIIGAGSGGYTAALRAAELGARVTVVEEKWLGGICLNAGCIPTKSLVESARRLSGLQGMAEYGINIKKHSFDLAQAMARKEKVVRWLVDGLERQLEEAGVRLLMGRARFQDAHHVVVTLPDNVQETLEASATIIATGSRPAAVPGLEGAWSSAEALTATAVPKSLLIVGAGAIGVEFACIYSAFGSKVTLVEAMDNILPREDVEVSQGMAWLLQKRDIEILTSSIVIDRDGAKVHLKTPDGERTIAADKVLVAVGRKPRTEGLQLNVAGVRLSDQGGIVVDDRLRTDAEDIYAVGDVTGRHFLAHSAFAEGMVAAENAVGRYARIRYDALPACVYSLPEVASVGLSEQEARARGGDVQVGRVAWTASEKALIEGETDGMVKVVARDGRLLGLHIIGPSASLLVMEGTMAKAFGARLEELVQVIHPHPTLSEAVRKAMLQAMGRKS